jgi:hypothetical protein
VVGPWIRLPVFSTPFSSHRTGEERGCSWKIDVYTATLLTKDPAAKDANKEEVDLRKAGQDCNLEAFLSTELLMAYKVRHALERIIAATISVHITLGS